MEKEIRCGMLARGGRMTVVARESHETEGSPVGGRRVTVHEDRYLPLRVTAIFKHCN